MGKQSMQEGGVQTDASVDEAVKAEALARAAAMIEAAKIEAARIEAEELAKKVAAFNALWPVTQIVTAPSYVGLFSVENGGEKIKDLNKDLGSNLRYLTEEPGGKTTGLLAEPIIKAAKLYKDSDRTVLVVNFDGETRHDEVQLTLRQAKALCDASEERAAWEMEFKARWNAIIGPYYRKSTSKGAKGSKASKAIGIEGVDTDSL